MTRMTLALALAGLVAASTAQAADAAKHSGTIVAVDAKRSTVTLEEMGPWPAPRPDLLRRSIHLTPTTKVELVTRATGATPTGWVGGFTASPLTFSALHPGQYATVSTVKQHGRLLATSVEVVQLAPARESTPHNK